jgi:hypothetical protein
VGWRLIGLRRVVNELIVAFLDTLPLDQRPTQIALSAARFHGSGLELKHDKAGVSVSAHQVPEHPDHSLPATLRMTGLSQ